MNRPDLPADTLQKNNLFFRQLLFLGILITIGLVILKQLGFFVGAFLGASTLYVVLRPLLFRLTERHSWRSWLAAALLVLCTTVLLLGLGFLIYEVIAAEIPNVDTSKIVGFFEKQVIRLNELIGFEAIPKDLLENSGTFLTKMVSSLINTTYSFAANVFMMLVILYFMLLKGRKMERHINSYVPFKGKSLCLLKQEVKTIIFSNALGIPIVMLSQALAACLIYWLLGMNNIVFWAFVTAVCGLIPMIGTVIVSVPLGAYMIYSGELWQGILMIALGVLVIANVDNLCRMILMNKVADTHPLIVIFGVILGIPLFGFWGIIFGPLLISGFLLLMKIYYKEYNLLPQEAQASRERRRDPVRSGVIIRPIRSLRTPQVRTENLCGIAPPLRTIRSRVPSLPSPSFAANACHGICRLRNVPDSRYNLPLKWTDSGERLKNFMREQEKSAFDKNMARTET